MHCSRRSSGSDAAISAARSTEYLSAPSSRACDAIHATRRSAGSSRRNAEGSARIRRHSSSAAALPSRTASDASLHRASSASNPSETATICQSSNAAVRFPRANAMSPSKIRARIADRRTDCSGSISSLFASTARAASVAASVAPKSKHAFINAS